MTALTLSSLCRSLGLSPRGRTAEGGAAPAIVAAGLLAEWRFDDGAGQTLTDYSGNGHDGQLGSTAGSDTNDPAWAVSPVRLEFDGIDDRVIVPAFAGPDEYHLDVIVRQPATTGDYSMVFVAHGTGDATAILQVFRDAGLNNLRYRVRDTGGFADVVGVFDIYDNEWHLLQLSRSTSEFWAHVDGNVTIAPTLVGAVPASSNDVSSFGSRPGGGFAMQGAFAWAAWYSAAFDESQRAQNEQFARYLMSGRGVTLP
jgi:hypothetical protein